MERGYPISEQSVFDAKLTESSDLESFFASSIVVIQSQFFRRPEIFQEIEQDILPRLTTQLPVSSGSLRCWSAGCSDGREAYSLAFLIQRYLDLNNLSDRFDFEIEASDINPQQIALARRGIFTLSAEERQRLSPYSAYYRQLSDGEISLTEQIRHKVAFQTTNILSDHSARKYHLVCCQNVLVYYEFSRRLQMVNALSRRLHPAGFLFVDAVGQGSLKKLGLVKSNSQGFAYQLAIRKGQEVHNDSSYPTR